jgi:hypothetical protein
MFGHVDVEHSPSLDLLGSTSRHLYDRVVGPNIYLTRILQVDSHPILTTIYN